VESPRELEIICGLSVDRLRPEGLSTTACSALRDTPVQTPEKANNRDRLFFNHRSVDGPVHFCSDACLQLATFEHVQRVDLSTKFHKQSVQQPSRRPVSLRRSEPLQHFHPPQRVREQGAPTAFSSVVSLDSRLLGSLCSLAARENFEKERFWHSYDDEVVAPPDAHLFYDASLGF
jgi:hypothetical protein